MAPAANSDQEANAKRIKDEIDAINADKEVERKHIEDLRNRELKLQAHGAQKDAEIISDRYLTICRKRAPYPICYLPSSPVPQHQNLAILIGMMIDSDLLDFTNLGL